MFLSLFKTPASLDPSHRGTAQKSMSFLYRNANVVSCVFRALDDLPKMVVLRMSAANIPLPEAVMNQMVLDDSDAKAKLREALRELDELGILRREAEGYRVAEKFRHSLERFIMQTEERPSEPLPEGYVEKEVAPLHHLLTKPPSEAVRQLLYQSNLISSEDGVTKDGFGFFLANLSTQICILMNAYANSYRTEIWEEILELNLLDPDRLYKDKWDAKLISDLGSLKFLEVFENSKKERMVKISRHFRYFSFMEPEVDLSLKCDIFVETNFKVYAHIKASKDRNNYTILKMILDLFVLIEHPDTNFQELIVGTLTDESVKKAYSRNITPEQILAFFRKHTDPQRLEEAAKKGQFVNQQDVIYK